MLKLIKIIICIPFLANYGLSQCNNSFFPFKEGLSFEQVNYDGEGKQQGKSLSTIKSIDGTQATVSNTFFNKRGTQITEGDFVVFCEGDMTKLDFNSFIPTSMLSQYGDAEIDVHGDFVSLPNTLKPGQTLPDGQGSITVDMSNIQIKMDIKITERQVTKAEPIETPAGTFESYKITRKVIIEMDMMGTKNIMSIPSASWFAKNVGIVKTETYDRKGEINNYTLLTALEH